MSLILPENEISRLLRAIDQPARIKILLTIGEGEACVCHLEAKLGLRQAYISQHLMDMRKADVLETRREGRYSFYKLKNPQLLQLIKNAGKLVGMNPKDIRSLSIRGPQKECRCPHCIEELAKNA